MRQNELLRVVNASPFTPFTIHLSDGREFRVDHPDQIMVGPLTAIVGVGRTEAHSADTFERVSLLHITSLTEEDVAQN